MIIYFKTNQKIKKIKICNINNLTFNLTIFSSNFLATIKISLFCIGLLICAKINRFINFFNCLYYIKVLGLKPNFVNYFLQSLPFKLGVHLLDIANAVKVPAIN